MYRNVILALYILVFIKNIMLTLSCFLIKNLLTSVELGNLIYIS